MGEKLSEAWPWVAPPRAPGKFDPDWERNGEDDGFPP